jgi:hypothetical protein
MVAHHTNGADPAIKPHSERSFGLTFSVVFLLIAAFSYYKHGYSIVFGGLLLSSGAFLVAALAVPSILHRLNILWFRFGLLLHMITSPIILGVLFFLVVTPIGSAMRLFGKDFLGLRKRGSSYWVDRHSSESQPSSMTNQF